MGEAPAELHATVASAGPAGGELLLDDLTRLSYAPEAVAPQVRRLRVGQRVRLRLVGEPPAVTALTLAGLPL